MAQIVVDLSSYEKNFEKCVKDFNRLSKEKAKSNMQEIRGIARNLADMENSASKLLANERLKPEPNKATIERLDNLLKGIKILRMEISFENYVNDFNRLSKEKTKSNMQEIRGIARNLADMENSASKLLANERLKPEPNKATIARLDNLLTGIKILTMEISFENYVNDFNRLSKEKTKSNMQEIRGIARNLADMENSASKLLANERQKIKPDNDVIGRLDYLLKGINVLQAEIVGYNLSLVPKMETDIGSQKQGKK